MRYLPLTKDSRTEMLQKIGVSSVDDLFQDVPEQAFIQGLADLPKHKGEMEVERIMEAYANQNHAAPHGPFFLGAGTYFHHVPATVDYIIQRSEFLTAYTPYQPEIAQGTLQVVFQFQTMIAQLTGQDIANASLYDGATAMTEAALMAMRVTKHKNIHLHGMIHPHYVDVLESYIANFGDEATIKNAAPDDQAACLIVQSPDFHGNPQKLDDLRKQCNETGTLLIVVINEILSLGLLPAPSQADIVCGEAQSIGLAMSFGGPHLGFFACREKFVRQMPGRLVGETVDADGKRGFVLTLNTREQHIRRDKATSNICTNQGLCALAFTVHMALLGEDGFKTLARLNHERACQLADALEKIDGIEILNQNFFNEFVVQLPKNAKQIVENLAQQNIIAGLALEKNKLLLCATEMTSKEDIETFADVLRENI